VTRTVHLTRHDRRLCRAILNNQDHPTIAKLAADADLRPDSCSTLLNRLARAGLVVIERDPPRRLRKLTLAFSFDNDHVVVSGRRPKVAS
jgi:DNA-binding MarR family transcriptional regulator